MPTWDHKSPAALRKQRDRLLLVQLRDAVAPFSPFWRERLQALGLKPATISVKDFARLPAVGERDVCTDGSATSAARLVLQASEVGYALHADGPALRRALVKRLVAPGSYRAQVEQDTRPISYAWTGLGVRFPVASTRADLDVIARAGARLWQVLGLTRDDVVLDAFPLDPTTERTALDLAEVGAGSPTFRVGDEPEAAAVAAGLVSITALVCAPDRCVELLEELATSGCDLTALRTLLLVGLPTSDDRLAAQQALTDAGAPADAVVVSAYAPSGARVLWGECRESARAGRSAGLHTYPDLDLVEVVDPETAEPAAVGELVLTQLGFGGSALLRWRTGDLTSEPLATDACPSCGRLVTRLSGLRASVLVPPYSSGRLDLRSVGGALAGRGDLADWRVVVRRGRRDGADELVVYVVPGPDVDPAEAAVGAARDLKAAAGQLPTQIVVSEAYELPAAGGLAPRMDDKR